ncbi:MAG: hypothetical protein HZB18_11570 [Chloroflexi bacterium]|nr:hypothetical protein [Chloroflexota bacterium]
MNIPPILSINRPCDEALQWVREQLLQAGLRPIQTFDLHTARLAMHDCSCPNHGTQNCDCQMVVLLVYGKTGEVSTLSTVVNTSPATLILHGNDGQTWVSIAHDSQERANTALIHSIQQALETPVAVSVSKTE